LPVREKIFLLLASIFITSLVMANIIGITKIFTFMGIGIPVGIIPYPVTFLATDLISELYGRKRASFVVWMGFTMNIFMLIVMTLGFYSPAFPQWEASILSGDNPAAVGTFATVYGYMTRGTFASMVAYLIAQFADVRLFHFWKNFTRGKHLWLRNNASTMVSQIVDTVAVMLITFLGQMPLSQIFWLILSSYLFKVIFALLDTPFFYLGVRLLGPRVNDDELSPPENAEGSFSPEG